VAAFKEFVTQLMWQKIVIQEDFISHLKSIKSFFLLSKGEFFKAFFEDSSAMLCLPPTNTSEKDINSGPFRSSAVRVGIEDDKYFKKYKVKLRTFKFNYLNFENINNLYLSANVSMKQKKIMIMLNSKGYNTFTHSGALWSIFR